MNEISFKVSRQDADTINSIVTRAESIAQKASVPIDRMEMAMDLTACHANGTPLRLAELLAADDSNFGHDVFGVRRHINRGTGELGDFFVPRFAKRKS